MPEVTADKIIGKNLYAKKRIDKLNLSLKKVGEFKAGDNVGIVYSYIQRNGNVYWLFKPAYGSQYLVKHDSTAFQLTQAVKQAIEKQKTEVEKEIKEEKGAVSYYIEKYGIWVLGTYLAAVALSGYFKNK